jgi:hypothetical protein
MVERSFPKPQMWVQLPPGLFDPITSFLLHFPPCVITFQSYSPLNHSSNSTLSHLYFPGILSTPLFTAFGHFHTSTLSPLHLGMFLTTPKRRFLPYLPLATPKMAKKTESTSRQQSLICWACFPLAFRRRFGLQARFGAFYPPPPRNLDLWLPLIRARSQNSIISGFDPGNLIFDPTSPKSTFRSRQPPAPHMTQYIRTFLALPC